MRMTQEGQKCIFMLRMEVAEEDMEVQEETILLKWIGPKSLSKSQKIKYIQGLKELKLAGEFKLNNTTHWQFEARMMKNIRFVRIMKINVALKDKKSPLHMTMSFVSVLCSCQYSLLVIIYTRKGNECISLTSHLSFRLMHIRYCCQFTNRLTSYLYFQHTH